MNRQLATVSLLVFVAARAFGACTDNTPTCIPATAFDDCICNKGERGHRVCDADGLHFGECICGPVSVGGASGGAGMSNASGGAETSGGTDGNGGAPE